MPDGRRVQRSTKSKEKMEALQIALKWERAARKKITVEQSKKVLAGIIEIVHGEVAAEESTRGFFTRWLDRKKQEIGLSTHEKYCASLKEFCTHIGKLADESLSEVTPGIISKWRDKLAEGVSPSTVNGYLKALKAAMNDAEREGLIAESPAANIKNMVMTKALKAASGAGRRAFTESELKKVSAVIPEDSEWRGMFLAGLYTGQRLSDIATMQKSEVKGGWWRFVAKKTGETRAVPLAKPLADWIDKHIKKTPGPRVFPASNRAVENSKGRVGTLSNQFHRFLADAGLVERRSHDSRGIGRKGKRSPGGLSFHYLRHTTNSLLKAAGVQESVAMDFVGHESEQISRLYTHVPEESLLAAARKLEDVLG